MPPTDLARQPAFTHLGARHVLVSGSSGLVGTRLVAFLVAGGHRVSTLVRRAPRGGGEIVWDPGRGRLDPSALEGVDAVVHLAGAGIADRWWTDARRREILASRVDGTRLLSRTLAELPRPPAVLVSSSAVGYYGDIGDRRCPEGSPPGTGFLSAVCQAWEGATGPAEAAGIRVVHLRTGFVLASGGGAMRALSLPFRLGLGGPVGSGAQFVPWVALDDLVGIIEHAIFDGRLSGPVNACAPEPVPQREFAAALGRTLGRPACLPLPGIAIRAALGDLGTELILQGQRAIPARLAEVGFVFRHPELEAALAFELGITSERRAPR